MYNSKPIITLSFSPQLLEAMNQDSELPLVSLKVDGGMTENQLLLQLQADLLGIPVGKSRKKTPILPSSLEISCR